MHMTQFTELSKTAPSTTRVINLTPTLSVSYPAKAKTTFLRGQIPTGSVKRASGVLSVSHHPPRRCFIGGRCVSLCVLWLWLPPPYSASGREKTKRESTERGSEGRQTPCRILEFHPQRGDVFIFGVFGVTTN